MENKQNFYPKERPMAREHDEMGTGNSRKPSKLRKQGMFFYA